MRDPMTQICHVRWPFEFSMWHVDPEKDGTDDSCGWFMRARHGDKKTLEAIVKRFDQDWDRVFKSDSGNTYFCGLFCPNGEPHFSVHGIVLNLFFIAGTVVFGSYDKTVPFMREHLFEILFFAENTSDSLFDSITRKFEDACGEKHDDRKRKERIQQMAGCIYSWILRANRPWYLHPRWHIHHWKIQWHFWQRFHRWAFEKCVKCGRGFFWREVPISSWGGTAIWHQRCDRIREPKTMASNQEL